MAYLYGMLTLPKCTITTGNYKVHLENKNLYIVSTIQYGLISIKKRLHVFWLRKQLDSERLKILLSFLWLYVLEVWYGHSIETLMTLTNKMLMKKQKSFKTMFTPQWDLSPIWNSFSSLMAYIWFFTSMKYCLD